MEAQMQELAPVAVTETPPTPGTTAAGKSRVPRRRSGAAVSAEVGLQPELHRFIAEHPDGWDHNEWIELLRVLAARGYDTTDGDAIGLALERERLGLALAGIPSLGERRCATLLNRYARLWDLQQAGIDEIARLPGMNAGIAKRIVEALR
jgi:hypothetical protein